MDRFIVGTGRCGSTLLSAMLHVDPTILSVSEFFVGLDREHRFDTRTAQADGLAELLSRAMGEQLNFTRRGIILPEIRYPYGAPGSRYTLDDPLPWILYIMLPALSDEPDALFDALIDDCRQLPRGPLADQYRAVFRWLAAWRHATDWVERSGSSLEYLPELVELFPDGRYLHLHRHGHEAALSMREHAAFRYMLASRYEIPDQDGVPYSFMRTYDPRSGPSMRDELTQIIRARAPVEYFGRYWSDQVIAGSTAIATLAPSQYMTLTFEDLIRDVEGSLAAIATFFELPGDHGAARRRAARLVRGRPATRFDALPAAEQEKLREACLPGMRALGRD